MRLNKHLLLVCLVTGCASTPGPAARPGGDDVRRFCAILDYVSSDYAGAVKDGQVLSEGEYEEQRSFVRDAAALATKLPASAGDAAGELAKVSALVDAKASPDEVAGAARALARRVLDATGVVLAPSVAPSRPRGAELYAADCASCHGKDGGGDGPAAAALNPKPRNFRDPTTMAILSPSRVYNALTDGVKGTAMAPMPLSPSDRWALAFYVFTIRFDQASAPPAATDAKENFATLAGVTDGDLLARGADVAALRTGAAYQTVGTNLAETRRLLAAALSTYRAGDGAGARQLAGQAYLDGFEAHEGVLRARDAALVATIEDDFLALRNAMTSGASDSTIQEMGLRLGAQLDRAEAMLGDKGGARVAFASALVVILREGVEAALLIMLLLGLARKSGHADQVKAVHLGWMAAALVGVATWFASAPLMKLGGARREIVEGVVALIATAALVGAGHFVIARLDAKRRVDALKRRLAEAGTGRRFVLAGLAFVAIYREAFEVVLFLRAIALDAHGTGGAIAAGVAVGFALLIGVVALLLKLGRRMKPGPLLTSMGTLLCVLAVVMAGKGVRALQEAGVIGISPIDLPRVEWLGVFPSVQGLVAQLLVLAAFVAIAALAVVRARRDAKTVEG
jgi:high-affinity iron transporter